FVVVAYPWHPLHGHQIRVYGRQGRAGRQILYIEVRPGLSREIPAWMCDAAVCAAISVGSARIAIDALTELRVVLDTRSAGRPRGGWPRMACCRRWPTCCSKPSTNKTKRYWPS